MLAAARSTDRLLSLALARRRWRFTGGLFGGAGAVLQPQEFFAVSAVEFRPAQLHRDIVVTDGCICDAFINWILLSGPECHLPICRLVTFACSAVAPRRSNTVRS